MTDMFLFNRRRTLLVFCFSTYLNLLTLGISLRVFCFINHGIKVLNRLSGDMNRMLLFVYSIGDVSTD